MEENKKNQKEEIQSRRDFFKRVAMGALPILGGIVLSNIPLIGRAHESKVGSGCYNSCLFDCSGTCSGGCMGCTGSCTGGCEGLCGGNCTTSCSGGCFHASSW